MDALLAYRPPGRTGYDFSDAMGVNVAEKTFNFGPRNREALNVDATLANLFECLTVECSGVLVQPQWKHFRHIKIVKSDKIRLSNGIWRSWHLQFQKNTKPLFCRFDIDPELLHHRKPEATVLEGKYWKRRHDAVANEYGKWRLYCHRKIRRKRKDPNSLEVIERAARDEPRPKPQAMQVDPPSRGFLQGLEVFPDYLLTGPTRDSGGVIQPRSSRGWLSADVMSQPRLDMLNPTLEELLDKLDQPMDVMLPRASGASAPFQGPFFTGSTVQQPFFSASPSLMAATFSPATPPTNSVRLVPSSSQQQQQQLQPAILSPPLVAPSMAAPHEEQFVAPADIFPHASPTPPPPSATPPLHSPLQPHGVFNSPTNFSGSPVAANPQGHMAPTEQAFGFPPSPYFEMPSDQMKEPEANMTETTMDIGAPQVPLNFPLKPEPQLDARADGLQMQTCLREQPPLFTPENLGPFQPPPSQLPSTPTQPHPPSITPGRSPIPLGEASSYIDLNGSSPAPLYPHIPPASLSDSHQQTKPLQAGVNAVYAQLFGADAPSMSPQAAPTPTLSPTPLTHMAHSVPLEQLGFGAASSDSASQPAMNGAFNFPSPFRQQRQSSFDSSHSGDTPSPTVQSRREMPPPSSFPFVRVSSTGSLGGGASVRPPLERGRSEPTRHLQDQVRKLTEQNEHQLREIEKHQSLAQKQYAELLQHYLLQTAGKTSEQQQHLLQSVIDDPSVLGILRSLLMSVQEPVGGLEGSAAAQGTVPAATPMPGPVGVAEGSATAPVAPLLKLESSPQKSVGSSPSPQPPNPLMSPTQLSKVTGVSDFQSRLVFAAAAQASGETSVTTPSLSQPTLTSTPLGTSPLSFSDFDTSLSPKLFSLNQLKSARGLSHEEKEVYKEMRRQSHITAEQKRRGNIKHGFEQLQSLVVNLSSYPSGKVSKATVLEKTLEHLRSTHDERKRREQRMEALRTEIEELNSAIAVCQEQLPASGVPVTRQRFEENKRRYREYVQRRTVQNYKFWIFSLILRQLFESYNSMVSTGTSEELCRTVLAWFEQNCSLHSLRPVVMNSLRELSMQTSILSDPAQVPQQLAQYAKQQLQDQQPPDLS